MSILSGNYSLLLHVLYVSLTHSLTGASCLCIVNVYSLLSMYCMFLTHTHLLQVKAVIGVLDIYGFEIFKQNRFVVLCVPVCCYAYVWSMLSV